MKLSEVIPWGRSFDQYRRMFALTDADLAGHILGCGDGPASFNAEAAVRGHRVVSCDPIYAFSAGEISTTSGRRTSILYASTCGGTASRSRSSPQNTSSFEPRTTTATGWCG